MKLVDTLIARINAFQQTHSIPGFAYAVVKKYSDNNGGYHAALLTYYGFLSLFPLLLILLTLLHLWFNNNHALQQTVSTTISNYFPLLGNQLQSNVETIKGTGIGLVAGILATLYGARGGADALRFMLDSVWQVPKEKYTGFPKSLIKSLAVLGIAALGFIATASVSVITSGLGRSLWVKILLNILGFVMLSVALAVAFRVSASRSLTFSNVIRGALVAGGAIQLLLTFGSLLVASQLKNLDSLYGTFAIVLGLLFWIYLLAQIVVYAAVIDTVREYRLWPRSLEGKYPTPADERAYKLQAKSERMIPHEKIHVKYQSPSETANE